MEGLSQGIAEKLTTTMIAAGSPWGEQSFSPAKGSVPGPGLLLLNNLIVIKNVYGFLLQIRPEKDTETTMRLEDLLVFLGCSVAIIGRVMGLWHKDCCFGKHDENNAHTKKDF